MRLSRLCMLIVNRRHRVPLCFLQDQTLAAPIGTRTPRRFTADVQEELRRFFGPSSRALRCRKAQGVNGIRTEGIGAKAFSI